MFITDDNDCNICAQHEQKSIWKKDWKMHAVVLWMMFLMVFFYIILTHFSDFKQMEWLKKTEAEDVVKELDELVNKLDMIATVIFTLIDVND